MNMTSYSNQSISPIYSVLLVEDSTPDAQSVIWSLNRSKLSFKVQHIDSAEAACHILSNEAHDWDILLTDHDLYGMNGLELCGFVQEKRPEIASILMTGYGNESLAITAIRNGVNEYIVKDTLGDYLDELPTLLHRVWDQHQEQIISLHTQRQQEQQMMNTIKQLEQQNAELDSYAETVAHELKNPLAILSGFGELLGDDSYDLQTLDLPEIGRTIASCGLKAINIVDELLKLGRTASDDIEQQPLATNTLVEETLQRLMPIYDHLDPVIHVSTQWPEAVGYGPWVEEVWTNYISNALKYGGRGPCEIWIGAERCSDGMSRFWVRDNGNGLTDEEKACLFQPYTRLHLGEQEGTGLGLSIVGRIISRLGGQVGINDAPSGGCEFWFTLPSSLLRSANSEQLEDPVVSAR